MKFKKYIFIVIYIEIKILQIKALDDVNGYTLVFFQIPKGMCFFFFFKCWNDNCIDYECISIIL